MYEASSLSDADSDYMISNYLLTCSIIDDSSKYVVENILTRHLLIISSEVLNIFRQAASGNLKALVQIPPDVMRGLVTGGFILPSNACELEFIRMREMTARFKYLDLIEVWIALTLGCNMKCTYCAQRHMQVSKPMTINVADSLIAHLNKVLKYKTDLRIIWYGGEPLLEIELMKYISTKILDLKERYGTNVEYRIITNGSLLNDDIAEFLCSLPINRVQITLDTIAEYHNKVRPFRNGSGSWSKIYNNIKKYCQVLPIILRANLSRSCLGYLRPFLKKLKDDDILDNISFSPSLTSTYEGFEYVDSSSFNSDNALDAETYISTLINLLDDPEYSEVVAVDRLSKYFIPINYTACTAKMPDCCVVGPEGELYKCAVGLGDPSMVVGNLHNKPPIDPMLEARWVGYDSTSDNECRNCLLLPACGGGCLISNRKGAAKCMRCYLSSSIWERTIEFRLRREFGIQVAGLMPINIYPIAKKLGELTL